MPRKKIIVETTTKITKGKDGKMYPQPRRGLIDKKKFEFLCFRNVPSKNIRAEFDNISHDTLARWCWDTYGTTFADAYARFAACGQNRIIFKQWDLMENGSEKLALWLGKQYCGQTDNPQENKKAEETKSTIEALVEAIKNI